MVRSSRISFALSATINFWACAFYGHAIAGTDVISQMASVVAPNTYTYNMGVLKNNVEIKSISIKPSSISITMRVTKGGGRIHLTATNCVERGFIFCKNYGSELFRITVNGARYNLQYVTGFEAKEDAIRIIRKQISAGTDIYSASFIDRRKAELSAYEAGIFSTIEGQGDAEIDVADLSVPIFTLVFPYNGRRPKTIDLVEGDYGNWDFYGISIPSLSLEEILYQEKLLSVAKKNEEALNSMSASEVERVDQKYNVFPDVHNYLLGILFQKTKKLGDDGALVEFVNKNIDSAEYSALGMRYLLDSLKRGDDVKRYARAVDGVSKDAPGAVSLANDYVRSLWEVAVKPSKNVRAIAQFIASFSTASGDILSDAYRYAVDLETQKMLDEYNLSFKWIPKFFISDAQSNDVKERIARKLFVEAIQEKERGDGIMFAIKYNVATTSDMLVNTSAVFDLYRDKDMKKFFKEQFDAVVKSQKDASFALLDEVKSINKSIMENHVEVSQGDIDFQNNRFLMQSYIFDKAFKGGK